MTCDHCRGHFEPRTTGGSKQRFCPGGDCRKAFHANAKHIGEAELLRRRAKPARLRPEECLIRAKDWAADKLARYIEQREKEFERESRRAA